MEFVPPFLAAQLWTQSFASVITECFSGRPLPSTLLKGVPHFVAQGPQDVAASIILFSTTAAGAITRNETYHKLFAIYCLCNIVWISFAIFHTLQ